MENKKKLLKKLCVAAAVIAVIAVVWLIYKPFFWNGRGIDPSLYNDKNMTGYEWITANMSEHMVFQRELKNEKTGETFVYYECENLREYLPNCRKNEPVNLCHRTNSEYSAWEVDYTTGLHQKNYITYYEGGRERKAVYFRGLYLGPLTPNIITSIDP